MDESMFEDIHEMAENTAYLKAVEEKDVSLEMWESLPPYSELGDLESKLQADGHINFDTIFHEPTGFYLIKCFLIADYSGDKALFVKDVESYKSMRFESARKRISKLVCFLVMCFLWFGGEPGSVFGGGALGCVVE